MKVRVRIAPSPTGNDLHIGNLYTALINWAYARQNQGQFVVRIEDTDRKRIVSGSEKKILQTLKNYGLNYDEGPDKKGNFGPYRQSERLNLYHKYAKLLIDKNAAYYCICDPKRLEKIRKAQIVKKQIPKYDRYCLTHQKEVIQKIKKGSRYVIRLKIPEDRVIKFNDLIMGEISFEGKDIDDQVLIKSDGYPTYHLGVVVDDYLMDITHIIRAQEWISSVPKHILLYEAFNWPPPFFCHSPILRNPDHSKLSKRKNPVWASWYLNQGYLPKALINYLCLMGWSHPKEKTIFPIQDFIKYLKLEDISKAGPIFDLKKLDYVNGVYIRQLSDQELMSSLKKFSRPFDLSTLRPCDLKILIPLIKERLVKLSDINDLIDFFFQSPNINKKMLKGIDIKEQLSKIEHMLTKITHWQKDVLYKEIKIICEQNQYPKKDFYINLYVIIQGKPTGLPLFESLQILGKKKSLKRIKKALQYFK